MKKYKQGQFVSIGGKLARVCKHTTQWGGFGHFTSTCSMCANKNGWSEFCNIYNSECLVKLGLDFYPKFIK